MRVEVVSESDLDAGGVIAYTDPEWLSWVVERLLACAAERSPLGGGIYVYAEQTVEGALLRIEDDGPSVAGSEVPALEAMGMPSLSVVAKVHGARVWAEPRERGGASLRVLLPT